jgi:[ribosomal protein S5]-alanine N-acetyltransferase
MVAKTVRIIQLSPPTLAALADGDLEAANRTAGVALTPYFVHPDNASVWRRRAVQVLEDPPSAGWITGVVWDVEEERAVGRAGFHGPPDEQGMVEVGYSVDPEYRRQGYARAALEALLARAAQDPSVRVVRASVRPDNTPSNNLIAQYGFAKIDEQWDDEDGLEYVYEVAARAR